jgi:hypothetical protein
MPHRELISVSVWTNFFVSDLLFVLILLHLSIAVPDLSGRVLDAVVIPAPCPSPLARLRGENIDSCPDFGGCPQTVFLLG